MTGAPSPKEQYDSLKAKDKKPFQCNFNNICKYRCSLQQSLKKHIEAVHEGNRPFICEFCDKTFSDKARLNRHVSNVHKAKEMFKCSVCDLGFARKYLLTKHLDKIHDITPEKPYQFVRNDSAALSDSE